MSAPLRDRPERLASPPSDADAAELGQALRRAPIPTIPSKYFYDERGSRLFIEITGLPEYYLTRTEEALLEEVADEIAARVPASELVELGSGASRKVRTMIDALAGTLRRCVLLDINEELLRRSVDALADAYPRLAVQGIAGDFLRDLGEIGPGGDRLLAFLGSTIGNLHPSDEVPGFLARVARHLSPEGTFLLGLDLVKDKARLEAAYNDAAGLTAEFNRNILRVLNARFGADFEPADFEHVAFYDEREAWIEMRLRARRRLRARVPAAGVTLELAKGDEIRTEISCKYTRESLLARATGAGLALEAWFSDPDRLFALALMRPLPPPQR